MFEPKWCAECGVSRSLIETLRSEVKRLKARLAETEWFLSPRPVRIHADGSYELPREVVERATRRLHGDAPCANGAPASRKNGRGEGDGCGVAEIVDFRAAEFVAPDAHEPAVGDIVGFGGWDGNGAPV